MSSGDYISYREAVSLQHESIDIAVGNISIILGVFVVIITILGLFLGIWINKKHDQISKIKKEVDNIDNDFKKILEGKESELEEKVVGKFIEHLIRRLELVPENICNASGMLSTFDLTIYLDNGYERLSGLFDRCDDHRSQVSYSSLLLQHFCEIGMNDDKGWERIKINLLNPDEFVFHFGEMEIIIRDALNVYLGNKELYIDRFTQILGYAKHHYDGVSFSKILNKHADDQLIKDFLLYKRNM